MPSGDFVPTALTFTTASASAIYERMRISADGKIGIGTTSPGSPLTVNGTIESKSGGFKFPDGSSQVSASTINGAYILIVDEKPSGTYGGDFNSGSWVVRTLNTIKADTGSNVVSLSGNQVTLVAGTYRCHFSAPAWMVNHHKARLRNATAGTTIIVGADMFNSTGSTNASQGSGRFTIAAGQALQIEHRCQITKAGDGLGVGADFGEVETFAQLECWKE